MRNPLFSALFFFLSLSVAALADESTKSSRPYLKKTLKKTSEFQDSDFEKPLIFATTSIVWDIKFENAEKRLLDFFRSTETKGRLVLPPEIATERELKGIDNCSLEYCAVKLSDSKEKKRLIGASSKKDAYLQILEERIEKFGRTREWLGYEDREENTVAFKKSTAQLPFLSEAFPVSMGYINSGLWERTTAPHTLKNTIYRREVVDMKSDRMQLIFRAAETLWFQESDSILVADLHVYSNHYFDYSSRFFELFRAEEKVVLAIHDIVEIDELKKSSVIRFMYKGKMQDAVLVHQKAELNKIVGGA